MKRLKKKDSNIKATVADMLELPKEILLNIPLLTIIGREQLSIENYNGIVEYTDEQIRLNTSCGVLKIQGKNLSIKEITSENMDVYGIIFSLEYIV